MAAGLRRQAILGHRAQASASPRRQDGAREPLHAALHPGGVLGEQRDAINARGLAQWARGGQPAKLSNSCS